MKAMRSGCRSACALRMAKGDSSRHSPTSRQRCASSPFSTVSNCMRSPLPAVRPAACPIACHLQGRRRHAPFVGPEGSALSRDGNDRPAVGTIADLLILIVGFHLEAELATIDFEQLGPYRDRLAFCRGAEVLDVDLKADGGVPIGEMGLHRLDAGALHQADHGR